MRTVLVTGSDTGVGKTQAVAALARHLAASGSRVQIVKPVETGVGQGEGDAPRARRLSDVPAEAFTLTRFAAPLSPPAAAALEGLPLSLELLLEKLASLPDCDWRICEGAGGIATPVDGRNRDWADFGSAIGAAAAVIVVADRLGAINQARLAAGRAASAGLRHGIWLNAAESPPAGVAESNRSGLEAAGLPIWAEQGPGEASARLTEAGRNLLSEDGPASLDPTPSVPRSWIERCRNDLSERDRKRLRRRLRVAAVAATDLNLADNDYLGLASDPAVTQAASAEAFRSASASASPLITGWKEPHASLSAELSAWHGLPHALLWSSGYAANSAVLGVLPRRGDVVLADRLVHQSLIAGMLRSGARIRRYPHLDLDRLDRWLAEERSADPAREIFVVTESVFSMDGDYPDLGRMAELKSRHRFCWILDEAHALGWYGRTGAGLAAAAGVAGSVDVLVGTLGKTLGSGGAYTLFAEEAARDYVMNFAGEFIYSTGFPPANAAAAQAAIRRIRDLAPLQPGWHAASRSFRAALRDAGWAAAEGDSPIVPVRLDDEDAAVGLADALRASGIWTAAVRPPTVPAGTSRLRLSLKRTFGPEEAARVLSAMAAWRSRR
jgi:8-amino-7-oxononanoate synthase